MTECGERHPGAEHEHKCSRRDGHWDEHICGEGECDFDWNFTQWRYTPNGWVGNRDAPEMTVSPPSAGS